MTAVIMKRKCGLTCMDCYVNTEAEIEIMT